MKGFTGYEIDNGQPGSSVAEFATYCNADASCVGFDSGGWQQSALLPIDEWVVFTDNPCLGFYTKNAGNALLIDLLALLMCKTFLGNTDTWPHVAFFPLETRVESLEYRLPPHVSVMICYCNCNSYSMSVVFFKDLLCIFDVPILGR